MPPCPPPLGPVAPPPQGPARHAYGAAFLHALEQLCFEFLQRLESALPPPDLSQVGGA